MNSGTIVNEQYLKGSLVILRETFEGSPVGASSAYLDREIGLFSTLEEVDADHASTSVNGSTIAAHTEHLKFYVDRLREFMEGRADEVNWEQSWLIETVNEEEWSFLKQAVAKSYEQLLLSIAGVSDWDENNIGDMVAIIAHSAYHLGAIRQIAKSVEPKR
ncbi:MAG: DinB family protein [Pyrinomonadaceae bacterium]|nr:DinB family protein [Pyrinomonadaceae bacterium]